VDGVLKRHLAPQTLERLLRNELCPPEPSDEPGTVQKLINKIKTKKEEKSNEK
jgi:diadenylate cyclase